MTRATLKPAAVAVIDLCDATRLWNRAPDAMRQAIDDFEQLLQAKLDAFDGWRLTTADAELAVAFPELDEALGWADALLRALADADWPDALAHHLPGRPRHELADAPADAALRATIGIDIGVLHTRIAMIDGAPQATGAPIDAADALARQAPAGAIALSPTAADLFDARPAWDVDLTRIDEVHPWLAPTGLDARPGTTDTPAHDERSALPQFDGTFVDRVTEFDRLASLFDDGARHLAVCGGAGVGKSRLSAEFARSWLAHTAGAQAWFCDLSEVAGLQAALASVARTTGVQIPRSETRPELDARLAAAFAARGPTLLILDDVDHLAPELHASVDQWLEDAPRLHILLTRQRQPASEAIAVVDVEALGPHAARALLTDRLRWPAPPSPEWEEPSHLDATVESCGRLPLALELAAGTARNESERPLRAAAELGRPPARGELAAALQRSWQLLGAEEQTALAACTVFARNFTAEAATSVIEAVLEHKERAEDLLTALRKASLIRADGRPDAPTRLTVLAPVRGFVRERAAEALRDEANRAHLRYYTAWATRLQEGLRDRDEAPWVERGRTELANLYRAAALARRIDLDACLTILAGLADLDRRVGPLGGFVERTHQAVQAAEDAQAAELELRAVDLRAETLMWAGRYEAAEADYRRALALADSLDADRTAVFALSGASFATAMQGQEAEAMPELRRAVEALPQTDTYEALTVLENAAVVARHRHEIEEAMDYLHRALLRARRRGNAFNLGSVLFLMGTTLRDVEQYDEAIRCLEEASEHFSAIDDRRGRLVTYHELAISYNATDQRELAEQCYREAMDLSTVIGEREYSGLFWLGRGSSRFSRGEYTLAESDLLEASLAVEEVGHIHLKLPVLMYLGATYGALQRVGESRNYFERAKALLEQTEVTREKPSYEVLLGYLDAARAQAAMRRQDEEAAERLLREAYARAEVSADADQPSVRVAMREADQLRHYLDERVERGELPASASPDRSVLRIGPDMRWFAVDDAERVDISRRGVIRRILRALVDQRTDAPGEPLTSDALVDAGWPDEVLTPESGSQRMYMTISRMRGLGLKGVLETVDEGYRIAPSYTPVCADRDD